MYACVATWEGGEAGAIRQALNGMSPPGEGFGCRAWVGVHEAAVERRL